MKSFISWFGSVHLLLIGIVLKKKKVICLANTVDPDQNYFSLFANTMRINTDQHNDCCHRWYLTHPAKIQISLCKNPSLMYDLRFCTLMAPNYNSHLAVQKQRSIWVFALQSYSQTPFNVTSEDIRPICKHSPKSTYSSKVWEHFTSSNKL